MFGLILPFRIVRGTARLDPPFAHFDRIHDRPFEAEKLGR